MSHGTHLQHKRLSAGLAIDRIYLQRLEGHSSCETYRGLPLHLLKEGGTFVVTCTTTKRLTKATRQLRSAGVILLLTHEDRQYVPSSVQHFQQQHA